MDLNQVPELEQALLQVLRVEFPMLCRYDGGRSLVQGRNLILGSHRVGVQLRQVRSEQGPDRHVLMVKTPRTPVKTFRETKAGWFVVEHVAKHLASMVQLEKAALQAEARERQLQQTARNTVQRLEAQGLPDGCSLAPSTKLPGGLDLTVQGLSEPAMRRTLEFLGTLIRNPNDESTGLWAQLANDDEATEQSG